LNKMEEDTIKVETKVSHHLNKMWMDYKLKAININTCFLCLSGYIFVQHLRLKLIANGNTHTGLLNHHYYFLIGASIKTC
jgi:hypothetical protein